MRLAHPLLWGGLLCLLSTTSLVSPSNASKASAYLRSPAASHENNNARESLGDSSIPVMRRRLQTESTAASDVLRYPPPLRGTWTLTSNVTWETEWTAGVATAEEYKLCNGKFQVTTNSNYTGWPAYGMWDGLSLAASQVTTTPSPLNLTLGGEEGGLGMGDEGNKYSWASSKALSGKVKSVSNQISMPCAMVPTGYYLLESPDYPIGLGEWVVEGSNDGIVWTVLDRRNKTTTNRDGASSRVKAKDMADGVSIVLDDASLYSIRNPNSIPYRFFKLTVFRSESKWVVINDLILLGYPEQLVSRYPPPYLATWTKKDMTETEKTETGMSTRYTSTWKPTPTTPDPYAQCGGTFTVEGSNEYDGGENEWYPASGAWDGRITSNTQKSINSWSISDPLAQLPSQEVMTSVHMPCAIVIVGYSLFVQGGDAIRSWRLEASKNGVDWVILDKQANADETIYDNRIRIANPARTAYRHYRLIITEADGYVWLEEVLLYGYPESPVSRYPPPYLSQWSVVSGAETDQTSTSVFEKSTTTPKIYDRCQGTYTSKASSAAENWPSSGAWDGKIGTKETYNSWAGALNITSDEPNSASVELNMPCKIIVTGYAIAENAIYRHNAWKLEAKQKAEETWTVLDDMTTNTTKFLEPVRYNITQTDIGKGYDTFRLTITASEMGLVVLDEVIVYGYPDEPLASPVDCVMRPWSPWTECSAECGGGVSYRQRSIQTPQQGSGAPCPEDFEIVDCNEDVCNVDCVVDAWSEWSVCSASCGGGVSSRVRQITTQQGGLGRACPPTYQDRACNEDPCPFDCEITEWSQWSACSATCGGGTQQRNRTIVQPPVSVGKPCMDGLKVSDSTFEEQQCNTDVCNIDCKLSEWTAWSDCSQSCGPGHTKRTREVLIPRNGDGAECGSVLEEAACYIKVCEGDCVISEWAAWSACSKACDKGKQSTTRTLTTGTTDAKCPTPEGGMFKEQECNPDPCPVDCVVGEWSATWSECSATCGTGVQARTRAVTTEAQHGGKECPPLREEKNCQTTVCPVDCVLGPWSEWGACSEPCGTGKQERTRDIATIPLGTGAPCGEQVQSQDCNTQVCPVDCIVGTWGEWSSCSATCDVGTRERTRTLTQPVGTGAACPAAKETQDCPDMPRCPVDCVVSEWSDYGACSLECKADNTPAGQRRRTRTVTQPQVGTGEACPALFEDADCNTQPCPRDCTVKEWSAWAACSVTCGEGKETRTRVVDLPQIGAGAPCPELEQSQVCFPIFCPVDCTMSEWSEWSGCSKTCAGGTQVAYRTVKTEADFGGDECTAQEKSLVEKQQACNEDVVCPVDCVMGEWTEWSAPSASCGPSTVTRTRAVAADKKGAGKPCSDELQQEKTVFTKVCPVNCVMSPFGEWSACTATCGTGVQERVRTVTTEPVGEGTPCGALKETQECNTAPCAVDCQVSAWGEWSTCPVTCGGGEQTRARTVTTQTAGSGQACPALEQTQSCGTTVCPVDCVLSAWADWGECSATCGTGNIKLRSRTITTPSAGTGTPCGQLTEQAECNNVQCPRDCEVNEWTQWSACGVTCGGGKINRSRAITVEPLGSGTPCPALTQEGACNTQSCPTDCKLSEWSAWGACSITCGTGGLQVRTKTVAVPPAGDKAKQCNELAPKAEDWTQTQGCDRDVCPVDCQVTAWSAWSTCTRACGGGKQGRTRTVNIEPVSTGLACPSLWGERLCNLQLCPQDCLVSEWSEWTQCSVSCGGGGWTARTRTVRQEKVGTGKECPAELKQNQDCSSEVAVCPVDCEVSEWTEWSGCSRTCGGGQQLRQRSIKVRSAGAGKTCPSLEDSRTCNADLCPIDCKVSDWGEWSACSITCGTDGTQVRQRTIEQQPANGGAECPALSDSQKCDKDVCPVDCVVGDWSVWSECSAKCAGGTSKRTRLVTTQPVGTGRPCPQTEEVFFCNMEVCPIDCKASEWTAWSACSVTCGANGKKTRTRYILNDRAGTGADCPTDMVQDAACAVGSGDGLQVDVCAVDCVVSEWNAWSACTKECRTDPSTEAPGTTSRTRTISVAQAGTGTPCPDVLKQDIECGQEICPVDCAVSEWTSWSTCTVTCGGGQSIRTRDVTTDTVGAGKVCPELFEQQLCNADNCPIDCQVTDWTEWSPCSKSCAGGTQTRTRQVTVFDKFGGVACPELSADQACNTEECPTTTTTTTTTTLPPNKWSALGCYKTGRPADFTKFMTERPNGVSVINPENCYVHCKSKGMAAGSYFALQRTTCTCADTFTGSFGTSTLCAACVSSATSPSQFGCGGFNLNSVYRLNW